MNEGKGQTVRDWSGNGNNGQLGSTAGVDANDPTWIRGIYGWSSGLHFDGNQFVQIPDSNDLEPQPMTVSAWFRGSGARQLPVPRGQGLEPVLDGLLRPLLGPERRAALLRRQRRRLRIHGHGRCRASVWDGKWHNASGTYDGTTVAPLRRRQGGWNWQVAQRPAGGATPSGNTTLGAYVGSCDLTFTGDLDEVSIWKKALPIAEIWQKAAILLQPH